MFDVAVIGAGVNGCAVAYCLAKAGKRVALIDRCGIASGGSGAAGAFINPKISKGGPLKAIIEDAYRYSISFYATNFPDYFTAAPLCHIARHEDENEKVAHFKAHTTLALGEIPASVEALLSPFAKGYESVFLKESGVVDAQALCQALAKDAELFLQDVGAIDYSGGVWHIGDLKAQEVVLCTGAYRQIVELPYIKLRGVWGHRIDITTDTHVDAVIHHLLSVSPTRKNGMVAIGATHNVHYSPETSDAPYDIEAGRCELLQKAQQSVALENIAVVGDFTGLRSGSNDYIPIAGPLVDVKATLDALPVLCDGAEVEDGALMHYPGLYMLNGSGGYGFVLAPYLAKQLADLMVEGRPLDARLLPSRFFRRWVKKR